MINWRAHIGHAVGTHGTPTTSKSNIPEQPNELTYGESITEILPI